MLTGLIALAAAQLTTPQLEPMAFLVGHCWQGEFRNGHRDTHCYEAAQNGRFIRDNHEVTGGYAGETLYSWNAEAGQVEYVYWANSGGVSRGSMTPRGAVLDFGDEVHRGRDGREIRISTTWHRIGDDAYEARITSANDPTGSQVVRYTRLDRAPVRMEESTAADGTRSLSHELVVPASPADVYAALTTPEGWRSWAVPNAWAVPGEPDLIETSYAPGARLGNPANIRQRILAGVANRLIVFRTVQFPPDFPDAEAFARTTAVFELEPSGSGTRVRLTGTGYPAGPAGERVLGFFREGNRVSLEQLRRRFVSGPIDWARTRQTAGH